MDGYFRHSYGKLKTLICRSAHCKPNRRIYPSIVRERLNEDFQTESDICVTAMLTEMRRQITEMLQRSHPQGGLPGDSGFGVSTKIGDDDIPKNKSTSTTKVS